MIRCGQILVAGVFFVIAPVVGESLFAPVNAQAQEVPNDIAPRIAVQQVVDEVIRIASEMAGDTRVHERREKLREVIKPRFDFAEMAKRSLGAQWKDCSSSEQEEFVSVFSKLLAKTYLSRIETVKPGMVRVESERVDANKAMVRTIVTSKGDEFPIDYKMLVVDEKWRVYDVVIENIGLVANYRNEFAGIVRKETFAGLMKRLRTKAEEVG